VANPPFAPSRRSPAIASAIPRNDKTPVLFAKAMACHRAGRLRKAIALYRRILQREPDLPEVHANLGVALAAVDRLGEAAEACRRAIELKPDNPEAWCNWGVALSGLGRFDEAEEKFRRSISLDRGRAGTHSNLGNALRALGRLDDAEASCRTAIAIDPDHPEAYANLGLTLSALGRFVAAEEMFARALALNPDNAEAHSGLGSVFSELGRSAEAVAAFRRATALKPDFAGAYNSLGIALKEAGEFVEAGRAIEQAIRLAPKRTGYYYNLGEVRSFTAGDPYVTMLERLANDTSLASDDRIHLHFTLAKAYEDLGRSDSAFQHLLAGNRLKRRQIAYDETGALARIDRVRELFTSEMIERLQGCGEPSSLPVFIVGMPRSGTTLVEQILASHPDVFGAGELKLLDQAAARICDLLPGSPTFPDMVSAMAGEHCRALGAFYLGELERRAPEAVRITDKMPSNYIFAGLIHLALPGATIIHVMRDPVATCVSCFTKHFSDGQAHTYDLAELGRYYRHYHALIAHWHRVLPRGRILDVRYEDVVADLEGSARRIVAHCGLEWDARCLDFHRTERTVKTASAAQVRRPIYANAVAGWRRYEPFLGPLLAELEPILAVTSPRA
jgi:tetratricopeptide (TPR) repeat protein